MRRQSVRRGGARCKSFVVLNCDISIECGGEMGEASSGWRESLGIGIKASGPLLCDGCIEGLVETVAVAAATAAAAADYTLVAV
ncbi:hypothetical protein E2C01_042923 [Portunus trituberculatus]|uniref:Uncharacterized protein n=1 Tax=Portunus trituberculatus TaxID=210409 RepID=A0A5B7FUX8_PORTR|nr:hypothetical protein [Portunus trituberculatus]